MYVCRINTIEHIFPCFMCCVLIWTWRFAAAQKVLWERDYYEEGLRNFCVLFCCWYYTRSAFGLLFSLVALVQVKKPFLHVSKAVSQLLWYWAFFFFFFLFFNQSVCFCDDSAWKKKSVTQARAVVKRAASVGLKIYRDWENSRIWVSRKYLSQSIYSDV